MKGQERSKLLVGFVDERNEGDGGLANKRGQESEIVERLFRVGVKDGVLLEGDDAGFFVSWLGHDHDEPPAQYLRSEWMLAGAESYSKSEKMARQVRPRQSGRG